MAKCPRVDGDYPFELQTPVARFMNRFLTGVVRCIFPPILRLVLGLRVEGKENLDALRAGAVSVCNHVHPLDCVILACCCGGRPISFLSLKSNLELPVVGHIIRWLRAVPVPETAAGYIALRRYVRRVVLEENGLFQVYPEGWLVKRCDHLREFRRGSFAFACDAGVPVLPFVLTERPWQGPAALLHRRPALTLHILAPVPVDADAPARVESVRLEQEVRRRMEAVLAEGGNHDPAACEAEPVPREA